MTHLFQSIFLFLLLFVPNISQARSVKKQEKPLFVLFHGLGNHAASFTKIKEGLTQAFSADAVVALTSVEGMKSITLSIPEQAEEAFKELSGKVSNLQDRWIFLVGHSQGGLRAYDLLEQYRHALHIKGLITLASPWEGAPGTRVDEAMLSAHLTAPVLDDLRRLSVTIDAPSTGLEEQFMCKVAENQRVCLGSGAKDLIADSAFLAKVKKQLPHEQVPILAIGGGASDFGALLAKKKARPFKALNEVYTFFVVGEHPVNRKHDMQVPLYSQHAENIVAKKKKNFTRIFIKDAFHSSHVWSIPVPKDKSILDHPDTVKGIIRFAKRVCK